LYRHASRNAQEALNLARQKAEQFDKDAALERKTNEALALSKAQAHIRDDTPPFGPSATPLVDCMGFPLN
jgi:DNA helicase INO80